MNRRFYLIFKQIVDWILAFLLLVLIFPLLALIAIAVAIDVGCPILFVQWRGGYRGQLFQILKFRTMREARGANGSLLSDEARLTPFGNFLRKSSLDELPELINILRGEMSFVGPRPFIAEYLELYNREQSRRHELIPGITGWAQINGRNNITWQEKFNLDIWYVDNWSLWLDLKIIFLTVWKVLQREGISQQGHATIEDFMGN